jgi:hypothetical protein
MVKHFGCALGVVWVRSKILYKKNQNIFGNRCKGFLTAPIAYPYHTHTTPQAHPKILTILLVILKNNQL